MLKGADQDYQMSIFHAKIPKLHIFNSREKISLGTHSYGLEFPL